MAAGLALDLADDGFGVFSVADGPPGGRIMLRRRAWMEIGGWFGDFWGFDYGQWSGDYHPGRNVWEGQAAD